VLRSIRAESSSVSLLEFSCAASVKQLFYLSKFQLSPPISVKTIAEIAVSSSISVPKNNYC
jgi:hypothetical protein